MSKSDRFILFTQNGVRVVVVPEVPANERHLIRRYLVETKEGMDAMGVQRWRSWPLIADDGDIEPHAPVVLTLCELLELNLQRVERLEKQLEQHKEEVRSLRAREVDTSTP